MCLPIAAPEKCGPNENREHQHVAQGNGKEAERICSGRDCSPSRRFDSSNCTHNRHHCRQKDTCDPQPPMHCHVVLRYEGCLHNKQHDPARKECTV
jgi:hypothetical protein